MSQPGLFTVPIGGRNWGYVEVTGDYLVDSEMINGTSINSKDKIIGTVRGIGLLMGMELVKTKTADR